MIEWTTLLMFSSLNETCDRHLYFIIEQKGSNPDFRRLFQKEVHVRH